MLSRSLNNTTLVRALTKHFLYNEQVVLAGSGYLKQFSACESIAASFVEDFLLGRSDLDYYARESSAGRVWVESFDEKLAEFSEANNVLCELKSNKALSLDQTYTCMYNFTVRIADKHDVKLQLVLIYLPSFLGHPAHAESSLPPSRLHWPFCGPTCLEQRPESSQLCWLLLAPLLPPRAVLAPAHRRRRGPRRLRSPPLDWPSRRL